MALSPNSRHRSRLIREMSRDLNKTNHSCASSTGSHHGTVSDSTISDFDPENEAIMSTRQMDLNLSQRLPELRDTAKKYGRWNGGRQPEFAINTSAIGRAFPDFSQGSSSDDSLSIEVGRGAKTRQRTTSQQTRPQYSDQIDSPIVTVGDFQILSTPPMKSHSRPTQQQQDAPRSSTRKESQSKRVSSTHKENIPPHNAPSSTKKLPDYVSGATRTGSGEHRRTLAEIHARVADESDGSFIGDERPATITFAAKNSRFSSFQPRNSPLVNVRTHSKQQEVNAVSVNAHADRRDASQTQTPSKPPSSATMTSHTLNPTSQSFLLPNMPDISELVSGSFKDGTPVFTKGGRVQSRFSSTAAEWKAGHNDLDGIPVPQDEKDIFLSLQLLQEKVAALEMEKADTQQVLEDLQRSNYQLQAEKEEYHKRRRSDSALGMADSGSEGDYVRDNQKLVAEKTKLEAQLKSSQNRIDTSDRKISNLELRLKTNTVERDQAVKQLAEAFYSSEQWKAENESLRKENESLKEKLAQFVSESKDNARRWQQKESSLRKKVQRREDAVEEMREMTREIQETVQISQVQNAKTRSADLSSSHAQKTKRLSSGRDMENEEVLRPRLASDVQGNAQTLWVSPRGRGRDLSSQAPPLSQDQYQERVRSRSRSQGHQLHNDEKITLQKQSKLQDDFSEDNSEPGTSDEGSFDETTKTIHKDINFDGNDDHDRTRGSNYSSILGHGEMDRLRNLLADAKAIQQERLAAANDFQPEGFTVHSSRSVQSTPEEKQTLQRKPSAKRLTGILKNRDSQNQDETTGCLSVKSGGQVDANGDDEVHSTASHHRRHSENSIYGRTSTRRQTAVEEMTSAFIVPDITIHNVSHQTQHPVLSSSARRVLDNLAQHDGHNCTVCSRVASFDTKSTAMKFEIKQNIRIEKPVPVSDRMPVAGPYEDEPTMRPATAPGLALATVMKGLQDELAHLKMQLAQYQTMYNKHDASLGMRKRKALKTKIDGLLKAIDIKADQIYALYDVLEGQKQSGQEMSKKDVEITLQSIGVDIDTLQKNSSKDEDNQSGDGSDEESELDLPWEGIEDTTGTENGKGRRKSWGM